MKKVHQTNKEQKIIEEFGVWGIAGFMFLEAKVQY